MDINETKTREMEKTEKENEKGIKKKWQKNCTAYDTFHYIFVQYLLCHCTGISRHRINMETEREDES